MRAIHFFLLLTIVLLIIFAVQNPVDIAIRLPFMKSEEIKPLYLIMGAMASGAILCSIHFLPGIRKHKREIKRLKGIIDEEADKIRVKNDQTGSDHPEGIEFTDSGDNSFFRD